MKKHMNIMLIIIGLGSFSVKNIYQNTCSHVHTLYTPPHIYITYRMFRALQLILNEREAFGDDDDLEKEVPDCEEES